MRILAQYCYLLAATVVLVHVLVRNSSGLGVQSGTSIYYVVIGSAVLTLLGRILTSLSTRRDQRRRDRSAAALLVRLLNPSATGVPPAYAVYLRPFSTTGRLSVTNPRRRWMPLLPSYHAHQSSLEFETLLSEALPNNLKLVALGRPGEHTGAGRIAVADDEWKTTFQRLVRDARWIVMIPSGQGETRWELQELAAAGFLSKTVFVMPPTLKAAGIDMPSYWAETRDALASENLFLPPYTAAGQLFRLGRKGSFYSGRYLPRLTLEELRDSFVGVSQG